MTQDFGAKVAGVWQFDVLVIIVAQVPQIPTSLPGNASVVVCQAVVYEPSRAARQGANAGAFTAPCDCADGCAYTRASSYDRHRLPNRSSVMRGSCAPVAWLP